MKLVYLLTIPILSLIILISACSTPSSTSSIEDCELKTTSAEKDLCKLDFLVQQGDFDSCSAIERTDFKSTCQRDIAIKNKDISKCSQIETQVHHDFCFALMENIDENFCMQLENERSKAMCLANAGAEQQNEEVCSTITDSELKTTCTLYVKNNLKEAKKTQYLSMAK
jgi:hypothetical protein